MAEDGILISPLNSNIYKFVTLTNKLKAILISDSVRDLKEIQGDRSETAKEAYKRVLEFNEKYLQIKPTITVECPTPNPKSKTAKAFERVCRSNTSRKNKDKIFSVSLCIAVGSCNDPESAPGLAHLCEHCIFLGSENYQELEALQNYLEDYGGEVNALTEREYTIIYLNVSPDGLEGALDILVDCVTKPMFREDRILKELASVDAEFELKRLEEHLRLIALLQTFVKHKHPLGSFYFGNEESFDKKKVCDQMKAFWNEYYHANFMTLVIKGPETVCKLHSLAKKHFENIRTTEQCSPAGKIAKFGTQPFDMEKWRQLYKVIPDGWPTQKLLKVSWCLEPEIWKNYETKPILYLEAILEQKAEGGLVNVLTSKGLISKLTVNEGGSSFLCSNFCSLFTIEIYLTDEGFLEYVEVLQYLFGYLKLLQEKGPSEEFFKELKILCADIFHYSSDSNLESSLGSHDSAYDGSTLLVKELSLIAQLKPPRDIVTSKFLVIKFDRALISSVLEKLTPSDANYIISADEFATIDFPIKEKWFDLRFQQENPDFIEQLLNVNISPDLKFPPKNDLLTDTLCFPLDADHTFHAHLDHITMKTEDKRAKVRYVTAKCVRGYLPTARYNFHITSDILDPLDPGVDASLATWAQCCSFCLDSKLGTALSGLITCFVSNLESGIYLQLFGPSNKLPDIFEVVVKTMFNLENEINKEIFENITAIVIDDYTNIWNQYDKFAYELENLAIRDRFVSIFKKMHYLEDLSFERFVDFCKRMKNDMYIYGTLRGCITKLQSDKIMHELTKLPYGLWEGSRSFPNRAHSIELPVGERCIRVKSHNPNEMNSFVKNHYQFGQLTPAQDLIYDVIYSSLDNFAFLTLRTIEQLGYVVEVEKGDHLTVDCLQISVPSPAAKFTTGFIDERIDNMLQLYYKKYIVDEKSFKKNVQTLCRKDEKLSHKDVLTFFQDYMLVGGKNFRKLSIQVVGCVNCKNTVPKDTTLIPEKIAKYPAKKKFTGNKPAKEPWCPVVFDLPEKLLDENGYFITNFTKFTASLECYGLQKTYPSSDPDTSEDEIEIESVSGDDSSDQSDDSIWDDSQ